MNPPPVYSTLQLASPATAPQNGYKRAFISPLTPRSSAASRPTARAAGSFANWPYDGIAPSTNRVVRPVFATDSRHTLTSWNRVTAMSLARWGYINVPYLRGAIDLMARLCVGTGFECRSLSRNKAWAAAADELVARKFANIGYTGGESMDELLLHDCRCVDVDGDLGYVMAVNEAGEEKLQIIEGHRIRSNLSAPDPFCIDGVYVDQFGRRIGYNVAIPTAEPLQLASTRVAVRNFIYLAERNRPDELRSITNCIHALAPLQDLYEILAFEMQSVKKNSEIGLVVETPTPDRPPLGPPVVEFIREGASATDGSDGSLPQPAQPDQYVTREQVYGSGGKIPVLVPGEKLTSHDHNRPGPGIEAWSEFIIRGYCVGYGAPFEIVWNPETIGGANTRMLTALLRARLEQRRANLIFPKLRRVRFWILARAILRGELPPDPDLLKCEWQPKFIDITVDAGRESRERRANVQGGLDTYTSYFAEDGKRYSEQLTVRESEVDAQCAAADRLVKKYPGLSFGAALGRIAMLTPNGNEASGNNAPKPTEDN